MNYWKDWLAKLKDPSRDPYERRYRLLALLSITALTVWAVYSTLADFQLIRSTVFITTDIIYIFFYAYALRTGRIQLIAGISSANLVFGLLPMAFVYNGGIYAGAPNWFLITLVFTIATLRGKLRTFLVAADIAVTVMLYTLSQTNPSLFAVLDARVAFANSLFSIIITAVLVISTMTFQNYIARQERSALERQRREIEDLNRSQNRFFSSMSHEIRTPINTIIGMNELILRDETLPDETVARLESIGSASNMLLALINDVLDMSKMESGKMEIVTVEYDVASLLAEVVNMISVRAQEKGLQFRVDADEAMPSRLYGDEVRIKQVLVNLLSNAVKYTEQGSVTMSVQGDRIDDRHVLMTCRVEDTGMGIRKEAIPHLFDAFRRVDEKKNRNIEGTGLGLSIVKQIVDLMHGEIGVSSVYTKGSTFTFSLRQEIADASPVGDISLRTMTGNRARALYRQSFEAPKARVLIVDDNEMNLTVEAGLLRDTKMTIDTALSAREALEKTLRTHYDVIFMDHLMPETDGIECLKLIRAQEGGLSRETPVIVLTANAGSENQAMYAESGFDDYLLKPVSGAQLEQALLKTLPEDLINATGAAMMQAEAESVFTQLNKKKRVRITMESGGDLPKLFTDRYDIGIVNFLVRTERGVFRDNAEIDAEGITWYLTNRAKHVRSVAPSVEQYERFFGAQLAGAQHVIHIAVSHGVSESIDNAREAAKAFDNVTVVDSHGLSSSTGLLALYAARLSEGGASATAILEALPKVRAQISTSFVMKSGKWLERGGRVSPFVNALLDAFLLHPVVELRDGEMRSRTAGFSTYRDRYIRGTFRRHRNPDTSVLFIPHVGLSARELEEIRNGVAKYAHFDRVITVKASSAIAVNCGPGTFGLMFRDMSDASETAKRLFDNLPEERLELTDRGETEGTVPVVSSPDPDPEPIQKDRLPAPPVQLIDEEEAVKNCGSREVFDNALKLFAESAMDKADEIERYLREEDWENYTIKVHALKSSARLIGALPLSEAAKHQEALGNAAKGNDS